jgi:glyoxylase-like metal-dependent hydrolase (beta-lactamase superfamily II)
VVRIGAHDWEVVGGNGHSPEHACLYCPALKVLISGDQVLPKISSNVSVQPLEPEANPMDDWMASLDKVQARVPDDVLVLPAHNDCFHGLHARIEMPTAPAFAAPHLPAADLVAPHGALRAIAPRVPEKPPRA